MREFFKRIAMQLKGIDEADLTRAEKNIQEIVEEAEKKRVFGIELTTAVTKDFRLKGFDAFEVHPCKVVNEDIELPNKIQCIEQCEPAEAEFWSVYVHLVDGGIDCIADCETEKQANELVEFLTALIVFNKLKND